MKLIEKLLFSIVIVLSPSIAFADVSGDISQLQKKWAEANYTLKGDDQKSAYKSLVKQSEATVAHYPDSVEVLIWQGVIKASFAGAKSALDFSAMSLAKSAKADFEKALLMDEQALGGAAYTNLGVLYFKVPGWPIGFGDENKAKSFLEKSLAIDSRGIENNYFYADYLIEQREYAKAETYLLKAQNAPARTDRPVADKSRQGEISLALEKVRLKLQDSTHANITDRR